MRLMIKSGESVDNALQYLKVFLEYYKDDYGILQSDMFIHLFLQDSNHSSCPDNYKEYLLCSSQPEDIERLHIETRKKEAVDSWKNYVSGADGKVRGIQKAIDIDAQYLETAGEKKRKPDAIAKRRVQLQDKQEQLDEAIKKAKFAHKLDALMAEGKYRFYIEKHCPRKSSNNYKVTAYIILEDDDGTIWHFEPNTTYGSKRSRLRRGLPDSYVNK